MIDIIVFDTDEERNAAIQDLNLQLGLPNEEAEAYDHASVYTPITSGEYAGKPYIKNCAHCDAAGKLGRTCVTVPKSDFS